MCEEYEKGKLKDQHAMAKDMKEKPALKPVSMKCLSGLDMSDRIALLKKVN